MSRMSWTSATVSGLVAAVMLAGFAAAPAPVALEPVALEEVSAAAIMPIPAAAPVALKPVALKEMSAATVMSITSDITCSTCEWLDTYVGGEWIYGEHRFPNGADECGGANLSEDPDPDSEAALGGPHAENMRDRPHVGFGGRIPLE